MYVCMHLQGSLLSSYLYTFVRGRSCYNSVLQSVLCLLGTHLCMLLYEIEAALHTSHTSWKSCLPSAFWYVMGQASKCLAT